MHALLAAADPTDHVVAHDLFRVGGYTVTNHVVMLAAAAVLLAIVVPIAARGGSGLVPKGFRNMLEAVLQFLREEVARPVLGERTDAYIPFLWTMFLLILTANLLGFLPIGVLGGTVEAHWQHIGGTATGNFSITAGLALCSFVLIHVAGIREQGAKHYFKHFAPGAPFPIWILLYVLEIVGAVVKPFALAIRLFANMIAGHIVVAVLLGFAASGLAMAAGGYAITLVTVLGSVAMSLLEVFVAFLQAYIFTFLTALFVGASVHPEH